MKRATILFLLTISNAGLVFAQASGNVNYSQGGGSSRAEQNERNKRAIAKDDQPPTATAMFVEASVLMNIKADEYVASFAASEECVTVPECNQKMDATLGAFTADLKRLGASDIYVDFAAQNKIYGYEIEGSLAREKLVGFELKKNVLAHYKDPQLLDKLIIAAAANRIFDLIKVDYIVRDIQGIQNRLAEEAARIVKQKAARYETLLGIRLVPASLRMTSALLLRIDRIVPDTSRS